MEFAFRTVERGIPKYKNHWLISEPIFRTYDHFFHNGETVRVTYYWNSSTKLNRGQSNRKNTVQNKNNFILLEDIILSKEL